jgi:hypothetical protein
MVGVPPLAHDCAFETFQPRDTVPVNTLNDCSLLYIAGNQPEQYFIRGCLYGSYRINCCSQGFAGRVAMDSFMNATRTPAAA